jgi:glutathione synthase/RimK-type ligase-like ATP-grasp enzyme
MRRMERSGVIFLVGLPRDGPLHAVRKALHELGPPVVFFDPHAVLEAEVQLRVAAQVQGFWRLGPQTLDLQTVTAMYLRQVHFRRVPAIWQSGPGSRAWRHAGNVEEALLSWAELTSALVVNRPSAMASNHSKPYQASIIQSCGFTIPETLITTDPEAVLSFWDQHGTVIYKSLSSVRSIVARLTPAHRSRLHDITACPTQFQQYIPGHDYRVHVVGEEVFTCEIVSAADDYRYAHRQGLAVDLRTYTLPIAWAERCRTLVAALHFVVAGIDLRCTPEGQWYCFEVNPSPAFTYYQAATGQPIAAAIARLLATGLPAPAG